MEKWVVNLAEMTKLTALVKEKILIHFNDDRKPLLNFVHETEKNEIMYDIWIWWLEEVVDNKNEKYIVNLL